MECVKVEDVLCTHFCLIPDKTFILHFAFLDVDYKNLLLFGGVIKIYFNST